MKLAIGCAFAMLLAAAPIAVAQDDMSSGLGPLPRQRLPDRGCAAFLWQVGSPPRLLAMLRSDPATARLVLDGQTRDLPLAGQSGTPIRGLYPMMRFQAGGLSISVEMTLEERSALADGALIGGGTLTLERGDGAAVVLPVSGMVGCRDQARS